MDTFHRTARWFAGAVLAGAVAWGVVGCGFNNDSHGEPATTLGKVPDESVPLKQAGSLDDESVGQTVTVEGQIVQQCPSTGCWFRVKDETGELFVDLNPAGLRLKNQRVGQRARVTGRVERIGNQFRLEAQFVEFQSGSAGRSAVGTEKGKSP